MRLEIGPYPLDWDIIDQAIIRRSPGVIALGQLAANRRTFQAQAVLCAPWDIKRMLFDLADDPRHDRFWCAYTATIEDAERWADALSATMLGVTAQRHWHGEGRLTDGVHLRHSAGSEGMRWTSARR